MKKKIKIGFIAFTVIAITTTAIMQKEKNEMLNSRKLMMNSLMEENVEALASGEYNHVFCFGSGEIDCPSNHVKVLHYMAHRSL